MTTVRLVETDYGYCAGTLLTPGDEGGLARRIGPANPVQGRVGDTGEGVGFVQGLDQARHTRRVTDATEGGRRPEPDAGVLVPESGQDDLGRPPTPTTSRGSSGVTSRSE